MSETHPDEFLVHDILDGHAEAQRAFNRILARIAELQDRADDDASIIAVAEERIAELEAEKDRLHQDWMDGLDINARQRARIAELEEGMQDTEALAVANANQVRDLLAALEGLEAEVASWWTGQTFVPSPAWIAARAAIASAKETL